MLLRVLAVILFLPLFASASLQSDIIVETNAERASGGASALVESELLSSIAAERAQRMAETQNFSHADVDGHNAWYWFKERGYSFTRAGENIAVNLNDAKLAVDKWMNSEGHRANILNENFTEIGVGTAQGIYKGATSTYIVQLFGTPNPQKVVGGRREAVQNQEEIQEPVRAQVAAVETVVQKEPVRSALRQVASAKAVAPVKAPEDVVKAVAPVKAPEDVVEVAVHETSEDPPQQSFAARAWSLVARWISFLF